MIDPVAQKIIDGNNRKQWVLLNKKIHALLDEIGSVVKIDKERMKVLLKAKLVHDGLLRSSLTELTLDTQEKVIKRLEKVLNEHRLRKNL